MMYYILNKDNSISPTDSGTEWVESRKDLSFIVKQEVIPSSEEESLEVSTVFLGIDHSYSSEGPPILFETMIFPDEDGYQTRCSTYDQALKMHEEGVQYVKNKLGGKNETDKGKIS